MNGPTIIEALTDDDALGPWFEGDSWKAWRVVLKAAFGLPLAEDELPIFDQIAGGRQPPGKRVRELWIVVGRRGGKDSIVSGIATFVSAIEEAHIGRLRPGEKATVACIASDRDQAKIVLSYIQAMFAEHDSLRDKVLSETRRGLELDNEVEILVTTNNFRAVRGRAVLLAILDECAFYRDENSASPDKETYSALRPGLSTLAPESMIIGISSPYKKSGLLYEKYQKHFGKESDRVLVIQAPSMVMNPTLDPIEVEEAMEEDPEKAKAEWLAEFRGDLTDFISRELIDAATDQDVVVRPYAAGRRYVGFADVAGGTGKDSFTAAIGHAEGDVAVLDALFERRPPFNPTEVAKEVSDLLKEYGVREVTADRYAVGFVIDAFKKNGITYKASELDRSQIYLEALPLFTAGRARLIDNKRMRSQFVRLERKTFSTGKDRVNHPEGEHDDVSNAAAGALTLLRLKRSSYTLANISGPDDERAAAI
ncbi:hypothetical protein AKG11_30940 [Shinella sp. SUS2]|uniref:terminase large subunit domain-containing protein n=1 Tax=unclassified Shinella TaxID=2643062 RepID=UPI00067FCE34|nr:MULTISPECIES: terminase large subunit [unclassified Shinella]KNY13093.1 hypothetical protein AKG11_30940 [Shinella sp. SUS2]KOC71878.1 hypothetical protein AKG10_30360 [Shinella sp. GWS1]